MKIYYGLIGAGGHGREVMPMLRSALRHDVDSGKIELLFVVEGMVGAQNVNGYPVRTLDEFYRLPNQKRFNVAIGDSRTRERIAEECMSRSIEPFPVVADGAVILDGNDLGIGHMISTHTVVTSNVRIGRFFQANCQCNIAHDCVIGDYVTFAPGVKCNGNVSIGNHAYIGAGALIKEGTKEQPTMIGEGAVVGMGAVVISDVPPYAIVVGNPARLLAKQCS
jgi:sugar O-acyltransferase (sialic acid O-acetyltransferase NeuD family)